MTAESTSPDHDAVQPGELTIRPFVERDRPVFERVAGRLYPGSVAAARDPDAFRAYFDRLGKGDVKAEGDLYTATDGAARPLGFLAIGPTATISPGIPAPTSICWPSTTRRKAKASAGR